MELFLLSFLFILVTSFSFLSSFGVKKEEVRLFSCSEQEAESIVSLSLSAS